MEKPRKMILDCPFCGEQPEKATAITPRGIIYFLECTNDKCPAHTVSVCGDHFEQSSINKWNTRAMSTWLEGEVPTVDEIKNIIIDWGGDPGPAAKEVHTLLLRKLTGKV